jgi:hypothetical protein
LLAPNENLTQHAPAITSIAGAKRMAKCAPPIEPMAYSIRQFCEAHNISVDTYFRAQRAGVGPVTMKVGGRTLISVEAAAAWRREREQASQQARYQYEAVKEKAV